MKLTKSTHSATYKNCLQLVTDGDNYKAEELLNKYFGNNIATSLIDVLFYVDINNDTFRYLYEENLIYRRIDIGGDTEFFYSNDENDIAELRETIVEYVRICGCEKEIHPEIDPIDILYEPINLAPVERNTLFPDPENKYIQNYDQLSDYVDDINGAYVLYIQDERSLDKVMSYLAIIVRDNCNDLGIFKFTKEYVDFISFLLFLMIDDVRVVISIDMQFVNRLNTLLDRYINRGEECEIFNKEILSPLIFYNLNYEDATDALHFLPALFKRYFLKLLRGDRTYYED